MFYIILAILSGAMISMQSSYNGMLYPFLGILGVGFISNMLNGLCAMLYQLVTERKLPHFKGLPVYYSFGGLCAVVVLGCNGLLASKLGTAVTVCLSVSGQLFMSAVCDHFGIMGTERIRFKPIRIPGFLCILAGVFVINFVGAEAFGDTVSPGMLLPLLLFAILIGCITVFARLFNFKASEKIGRIDGTMANSFMGAAAALVLWLILSKGTLPFSGFADAPLLAYLTGPLGFVAAVLNVTVYSKMKIFHATIFLLVGQIAASIITDLIFFGTLPFGKLLGILIICVGIFLDKKFTAKNAN